MIFNNSHHEKDSLFTKVKSKVISSFGLDLKVCDDYGESIVPERVTAEVASLEKVKMWLLSNTNDYIREPGQGTGIQFELYNAPLTTAEAEKLQTRVKELATKKVPNYVFTEITFTPNEKTRTWKVYCAGYDNSTEIAFTGSVYIKADGTTTSK